MKKRYPEKLKIFEKFKISEFKEEDYNNFFDSIHKNTKDTYDPNGFNRYGFHKNTKTYMILMVLIKMVFIKILKLYMVLKVLIEMVIM